MPAVDQRDLSRAGKKFRPAQSSSLGHVDIPPPHLHSQAHIYHERPNGHGQYGAEPPSHISTSSEEQYGHFVSEHEIKFTRNEVCTPSTCICFFIAFLFSFMAVMSGIYYGLNFFDGKHIKERVFKVQFAVFDQELASSNLDNVESNEFKNLAASLRQRMEQLFTQSSLSRSYIKSEIVAFERKPNRPSEVMVHLNVHTTANKRAIEPSEIYLILAEEIANNRLKLLDKWNIDHNSLDVQERKWPPREKSALLINPWTYKSIFPGMLEGLSTEPTPAPRKCLPLGLGYCRFLAYNRTSYPNVFNHWNQSSVEEEFITYKEIIDSECYSLAKEFLCLLLQPECVEDEIVLPCKSFCVEFYQACQQWLPDRVASKIVCSTFPDGLFRPDRKLRSVCRGKPNCAASLRLQSRGQDKLCDGVLDCADKSDERGCDYCDPSKQFHCGNRQCVSNNATCDGVKDCRNGADETDCLTLLPDTDRLRKGGDHLNEGYLVANYKGKNSYVCSESALTHMQNYSHMYYNNQLQILGLNICNERHFEELIHIESKHVSLNGPFSKFVPSTTLISPYSTQCKNRDIYFIECAIAKCGINVAHIGETLSPSQSKKAFPGYWPWFAKLNLNGNYFCDGTLVSPDTVLAQSTCFTSEQHSLNHNLSVTLGSVRFHRDNIEAQRFAISQLTPWAIATFPNNMHLVRLAAPVNSTRFIRPICHNKDISTGNLSSLQCTLLNMNLESDQLQSRPVSIVTLDKCNHQLNQSSSSNWHLEDRSREKLCVYLNESECMNDFSGNELNADCASSVSSGRHMYCLFKFTWYLFAVESNWSSSIPTSFEPNRFILFDTLPRLSL